MINSRQEALKNELQRRAQRRQERLQKAKEEARRKAPGLSEQGDILQPIKVDSMTSLEALSNNSQSQAAGNPGGLASLKPSDYAEFGGIAPADPWESSLLDHDLDALREVMGEKHTSPQTAPKP